MPFPEERVNSRGSRLVMERTVVIKQSGPFVPLFRMCSLALFHHEIKQNEVLTRGGAMVTLELGSPEPWAC